MAENGVTNHFVKYKMSLAQNILNTNFGMQIDFHFFIMSSLLKLVVSFGVWINSCYFFGSLLLSSGSMIVLLFCDSFTNNFAALDDLPEDNWEQKILPPPSPCSSPHRFPCPTLSISGWRPNEDSTVSSKAGQFSSSFLPIAPKLKTIPKLLRSRILSLEELLNAAIPMKVLDRDSSKVWASA